MILKLLMYEKCMFIKKEPPVMEALDYLCFNCYSSKKLGYK